MRPGDIEFRTIRLTKPNGRTVDLNGGDTLQVREMNVYESALDYHTYADMTIFDPSDILGEIMISGDETMELSFGVPGGDTASFKFAMLQNADIRSHGSQRFKTYEFRMVSPEFLRGQSTVVDCGWNTETHGMVSDIVKKYFGSDKEVDVERTKGRQRFLGNSEPPHVVLDRLKDRHVSTTSESSAYSLFETRGSDGTQRFKFVTFETMMNTPSSVTGVYKHDRTMSANFTTGDDVWNILSLNLPSSFNTVHRWSSATNRSAYCIASGRQRSTDVKFKQTESDFKLPSSSPISDAETEGWDGVAKTRKPFRHSIVDKANDVARNDMVAMRAKKASFMARLMNDVGTMHVPGNPSIKVGETLKIMVSRNSDAADTSGESRQISDTVLVTKLRHHFGPPSESNLRYTCVVEFVKCGFMDSV
jgi:hypothetical protein